ncbi:predicted protein [Naegleria gruberi]|uniref:Predicted protein n=1 Tax=Naegleria gruberi TaxID=5762 RepID=D2V6L1_NAEGR|nr:uncharacterized protein NAEGRDRAFT_64478 [Naegleria gruberi]EFC47460.1 predicted protein [Naegleria gruberi]|eukprot:XP_002680204.1 predicted protein [Naegleria gruberi strain NEG-M]
MTQNHEEQQNHQEHHQMMENTAETNLTSSITNDEDYIIVDICDSCAAAGKQDCSISMPQSAISISERINVKEKQKHKQYQKKENVQKQETVVKQPEIVLFNTPKQVLEKFKTDGVRKSKLTFDQMTILSLFAGIFIGLASALGLVVGGNVPSIEKENPGLQKLLTGM